jgi:hypothetical protein
VDVWYIYGAELTGYIIGLERICTYQKKGRHKAMKTKFYLDGKKTTRKAVKELVGEEALKRYIEEAKETFMEDPLIQNDIFLGKQMLTIEFEF